MKLFILIATLMSLITTIMAAPNPVSSPLRLLLFILTGSQNDLEALTRTDVINGTIDSLKPSHHAKSNNSVPTLHLHEP
jgi:hypothetical protein